MRKNIVYEKAFLFAQKIVKTCKKLNVNTKKTSVSSLIINYQL